MVLPPSEFNCMIREHLPTTLDNFTSTAVATFIARRVCIARTMLSQYVCPSRHLYVCPSHRPSVTRRYSVEMAKHIVKLFCRQLRHTILYFPYQTLWQYYNLDFFIPPLHSTPLLGLRMQGRHEKTRLLTNISLYLRNDTRYSHSNYRMRIGNLKPSFRMLPITMTSSDP